MVQNNFFFSPVYIFQPHCHRSILLAATLFALRSHLQGEGHTAQVAVSGWIIDDALSI